jgi:ribonuclease HII
MALMQWLVGVDEAGRGPLAGPVAVGVVAVPYRFDIKKAFPGVNDSKKLTEAKREEIYKEVQRLKRQGTLRYIVGLSSAGFIDAHGITQAVRRGVWSGVRKVAEPESSFVKLDGLLIAPPEYRQETIIKGDALEPVISLASVVAKVRRDRLMKRLGTQFPQYGFEVHKGYGTLKHRQAIGEFGLCELHRRSFCHVR